MPIATLKYISIYNLIAAADQVKSAVHCMEEGAMHIPLLDPSLLAGVEWPFIPNAMLDITPPHQGILSGMFRNTGLCWQGWMLAPSYRHTASSALLPFFFGKWHLRTGVFCPWKWWLKLEPETTALLRACCLLQQCCVGLLEVPGFGGKFSFPLFTFLLGKEELLAGRLQVHRYFLLIRLQGFSQDN